MKRGGSGKSYERLGLEMVERCRDEEGKSGVAEGKSDGRWWRQVRAAWR